ncbi:MAG: aminotransferase class I/II-fold pyridoxal phosphate-dependent enzyme [Saprospiraceae bacterium]|nr:aminotransferase class I/II-fold pyridoxal phosphate-dependent enzyme [Saprospiraceae bacterium]
MNRINRRNWLKLTGLAGSSAMVGPLTGNSISDLITEGKGQVNGVARLNANENPFGPSEKVRDAIIAGFDEACRYPFAKVRELVEVLAKKEGVMPEQIVITGGSTEGLKATGLTYGVHGGEVISPEPTYLSLLSYAEQFGAYINRVPLNDDLEFDLDEIEKRVTSQTRLVFICNPNNPTGTIVPKDKIRDFCWSLSKKTLVFSDEAYGDFIVDSEYPSMIELVKEGANVIVSRTFSKVYGLAGMRIGYLIARPDIARRIQPNVMANTNMLAIYAALEALKDDSFYQFSLQKNLEGKKYIYSVLDDLGLRYLKSHTNFVFFHTGRPIQGLVSAMQEQSVQIGRPFPPLTDWCRISTGKMEDLQRFGDALKAVMS